MCVHVQEFLLPQKNIEEKPKFWTKLRLSDGFMQFVFELPRHG